MESHEKGTIGDLAHYRLEIAKKDLHAAIILMKEQEYRGANNRAYYAIYHAISAVHALDKKSYKRHKDTLANLIKTMSKLKFFPRLSAGKLQLRRKSVTPAIMMIFTLLRRSRQKNKLQRQKN